MSSAAGPDLIQNGLVLCLDAANPKSYPRSGSIWRDLSANNNNGTLINSPTFNNENGGSIVFVNANSNVNCTGFTFNQPNLTFNCWFRVNAVGSGYAHFISKELSCKYRMNNTTGEIFALISTTGSGWTNVVGTSDIIRANIWYNVTLTVQSNGPAVIYVNGISRGSENISGTLATNSAAINIGSWDPTGYDTFNGRIALAQVYNRALTATEVLQNYNALKGRFLLT